MSSIVLLSEAKGVRPSFGVQSSIEFACLRSGKDSFNVRARALNEYGLRSYEIVHEEMNDGQLFLLEDCWERARGGVLPMNFTPPRDVDANAFEVIFVGDSLEYTQAQGKTVWTARYRILEAL